jgi:predicted amidohydrolase
MTVLRAALVQTAPRFGEIEANLAEALDRIPTGCDLAVLPELCTTGYQFTGREELLALAEAVPDGPSCETLRRRAAATGTTIVAGLAERDGDRLFNTAVLVQPDGTVDRYRKIHLFWDEKLHFTPGDLGFPVFRACGTTVGLMVCFDWLFPEAAGTLARRGARVIAHPSNLVLPHCPDAMPVRALENRVFTLTTNRVGTEHRGPQELRFIGRSVAASPHGERLVEAGPDRVEVVSAELDLELCDPFLTPRNHVVADRRPEFYG